MPTTQRTALDGATNEHSSTMSQVAGSQPRNVEKVIESLDYMSVPLQRLIKYDSKSGDNVKQEWTDERYPATSDTLNGAVTATATGIVVANVQRFQRYNLIQVDDEIMWVSAINDGTSTLTVTRGGGIGSTSAAHSSGATVWIVGTATPENVDAAASTTTRGDTFHNFFQIFQHAIKVSDRQNNAGTYLIKGKEYKFEFARQYKIIRREIETSLFRGNRFAGAAGLPSMMGGIPVFVNQHVRDLAGQAFSQLTLMDLWQEVWDDVGPENCARLVICNAVPRRAISSFYGVEREVSNKDRKINLVVDRIETDLGPFDLMDPHFHCPRGLVLTIDPTNYKLRCFAGYGELHESEIPAGGAYKAGMLTADKTLIAMGDRASGKLVNVATSANDYPGLN